jgi:hypothetical protein
MAREMMSKKPGFLKKPGFWSRVTGPAYHVILTK